jgi:hypothetical protein
MPASDGTARAAAYAQRLIDNRYAQENLGEAVDSLRAAYQRASKRRVEPARDEKIRKHVRHAAHSISETTRALKTGRQKPKRRRRLLIVLGLSAAGVAAALASSENLRDRVLGKGPVAGEGGEAPTPTFPERILA